MGQTSLKLEGQISKLADFLIKYLPYKDKDLICSYIKHHLRFQTIDYAINEKEEIIGFVRWNIEPSGLVAHVLDLVIREDWRNKGLARDFLKKGLKRFKNVRWIRFERERRNPKRKQKLIPVEQILKRRKF